MTKFNKNAVLSPALHALLLLVVYILQAEVFSYIRIFGYTPALLPLAAVAVGMLEGCQRGSIFGLFAGIFCDISFNQPAATMTLTLTLLGLFAGYLGETVVRRGLLALFVCGFGALMLTAFIQMFGQLFFENTPAGPLLLTALCQALCSLIFVLPLYWAVGYIARRTRA